MLAVADSIIYNIPRVLEINKSGNDNEKIKVQLKKISETLRFYGEKAIEFGSIDIYARRLALLKQKSKLNELKQYLSIYLDLWEKFLYLANTLDREEFFCKIDKRYYSLLSIILQENNPHPKINDNISFISWNYDLQLEMAYASFMPNDIESLENINSGFNFMGNSDVNRQNVIHLNGHRGFFKSGDKSYETERTQFKSLEEYLLGLLDNNYQFRKSTMDFKDYIKYAWEEGNKDNLEKAKLVMRDTDILIIVGYSFPSFNREIDMELIRAFEETSYHKIIYQDPYANMDVVNAIFTEPERVEIKDKNSNQFEIPHEFLAPSPGKKITFGV